MCTAATYLTRDFYFGRTLDYERSFGEQVVVTPRRFPFHWRAGGEMTEHYALIGMACVQGGYPLYYDAVNERGLCMAGLNFVGNAVYHPVVPERENVASFELIPWLLGQCATVREARERLRRVNVSDEPFGAGMPASALHWMIADREACLVLESTAAGVQVYDNPAGVLTNNPPFPMQLFALNNYRALSPRPVENRFGGGLELAEYSRGMGAMGLPGDPSSQSRFVRAAFVRANARSGEDEDASVSQFFHILGAVEQTRGCCELADGSCEITLYTSCCNADRGVYYYTTYDNRQITAVDMHRATMDGSALCAYPLVTAQQVRWEN